MVYQSYIFSSSLHYLQGDGVDLMIESWGLVQTSLKLHQQSSEVGPSQIKGKVFSSLLDKKIKWKKKNEMNKIISKLIIYTVYPFT